MNVQSTNQTNPLDNDASRGGSGWNEDEWDEAAWGDELPAPASDHYVRYVRKADNQDTWFEAITSRDLSLLNSGRTINLVTSLLGKNLRFSRLWKQDPIF